MAQLVGFELQITFGPVDGSTVAHGSPDARKATSKDGSIVYIGS